MHFLKGERGYTMIEAIFQLVVLVLFAQIVFFIVHWFYDYQDVESMQHDVNWNLFALDLHENLAQMYQFEVIQNGNGIRFDVLEEGNYRTFIIEKSTNHIRKRSLLGGNEVMLGFVDTAHFDVVGHELHLEVAMKNGQERERIFIVPTNR